MPDDDKPTDCAPGSGATKPNGQGNAPLNERIAAAKEAARASRVAAGLPADADDGPYSDEARAARRARKKKR